MQGTVARRGRRVARCHGCAWQVKEFENPLPRVHRIVEEIVDAKHEHTVTSTRGRSQALSIGRAALLMRDCSPVACATEGADDAPDSVHEQPADAVSSLIVLPGLADPEAFKRLGKAREEGLQHLDTR